MFRPFFAASRPAAALAASLVLGLGTLVAASTAGAVTFTSPSNDRWMYPFNGTPGTRPSTSLFGANDPQFDDRDGQMIVRFDTGSQIAAGQGAGNYQITSARLTLQVTGGTFQYDPTYDDVSTYFCPTCVDGDAGRPIELYGVGYRNGFDTLSFLETSAYAFGSPLVPGTRNAYASDNAGGVSRDVSNNVDGGFNPTPFAVGTIVGLSPGDVVPAGASVIFDLALTPDVLAYLQGRLDLGALDLALTSISPAAQGGAPTYPQLSTKEGVFAPRLELDVTVVPEPGSALLAAAGLAGLALAVRRQR